MKTVAQIRKLITQCNKELKGKLEQYERMSLLWQLKRLKDLVIFYGFTAKKEKNLKRYETAPKSEHKKIFEDGQAIEAEQREHLVPMYRLEPRNNVTTVSLILSAKMEEIGKKCNEWYKNTYGKNPRLKNADLGILPMDLDYMFTSALWLVKLFEKNGFKDIDSFNHFKNMYIQYEEEGIHRIIGYYVKEYNGREKRPYTKKELNKPLSKATLKMLDEILEEVKVK